MSRNLFRDVGGGRRRVNGGFTVAACCVLLMLMALPGCSTETPASPNSPGGLTGQTTNGTYVFTGSLSVSSSSSSLPADDLSSIVVQVNVRDQSGNPVPNLTTVLFSTDLGGFQSEDENGNPILVATLPAVTFNGIAQVVFQSAGGVTGTARITASIGDVSSSRNVTLTTPALTGLLQLAFGPDGTSGSSTLSGVASVASPLDSPIAATAFDEEGDPLAGANISFRIVQDTTTDNPDTPDAEFVASRHTTTGPDGNATNVLRAFGAGTVAVIAEMYDPNTGALVATSNRIILTTSTQVVITLAFSDSSVAKSGTGTHDVVATVQDIAGGPQQFKQVRFRIPTDTTDTGAILTTALTLTDPLGEARTQVTVAELSVAAASVEVIAEVLNASGAVVATSNLVTITTPPKPAP